MIQTSAAVSTRPTAQAPIRRHWVPAPSASSGMMAIVTPMKAMNDRTPATARPLYRAGITFFMPGLALTNEQPMIDAMIDTPPSSSG